MKDNIPGYPGYHVTKDGKVYSKKKRGSISTWVEKHCRKVYTGYLKVGLTANGISTSFSVHRLVAMVYIPNPNNYPIVMHLDDNKTNNKVENLQWGTYSMNNKEAYDRGLKKALKGELHSNAKISNKTRLKICKLYDTGNYSQR